jgi:hypothetical protein
MRRTLAKSALAGLVVLVYLALFAAGARFLPAELQGAADADGVTAGLALLAIAVIDVALMTAVAARSRLGGGWLWLMLAVTFYGVKSITSQIEAVYFMPNVSAALLPGLLAMMLPVAVGVPGLIVWIFARRPTPAGAWQTPRMSRGERWGKILVLGTLVYPTIFFVFGYAVAWQSPDVRNFYGGQLGGFFAQLADNIVAHPALLPLEAGRGLLWVALALPILRTTQGKWWVAGLVVALIFALIQNDVHLLPNPLMPTEVRRVHFVETATSNFLFAWMVAFSLSRSWAGRSGECAAAPIVFAASKRTLESRR